MERLVVCVAWLLNCEAFFPILLKKLLLRDLSNFLVHFSGEKQRHFGSREGVERFLKLQVKGVLLLQGNCWVWITTTTMKVHLGAHVKVGPYLLEFGNGTDQTGLWQ